MMYTSFMKGYLVVAVGYLMGMDDHFVGTFSDPSDGSIIDCEMDMKSARHGAVLKVGLYYII